MLTSTQRRRLIERNLETIGTILSLKYERGEWRPENRFGSTIRRIDFDANDLHSGERLSDACLYIEERAGFQSRE